MDLFSLVLAGIALFFVFKLISVLGTRTGHEQHHEVEGLQRASSNGQEETHHAAQNPLSEEPTQAPVSAAAEPLKTADPDFDEKAFLDGARSAYEMIVEAFAAGDVEDIRRFLAGSVFDAFRSALAQRDADGLRNEFKFVGIEDASIQSAEYADDKMVAVVNFASNQVRATYNRDGDLIDGDPRRVDLVRDAWTFSRSAKAKDPNWTLVATSAAI